MTTSFVIAGMDDVIAIGESFSPAEEWRGFEVEGIDSSKMAMLHSILTGETFEESLLHFDPIHAGSEEGPWVIQIPQALTQKLNDLKDDIDPVAEELVATDEFEQDDWLLDDVQTTLAELADLAGLSLEEDKPMFMWVSE